MQKLTTVSVSLVAAALSLTGCQLLENLGNSVDDLVDNVDEAILQLERGIDTFDQGIEILDSLANNLDDGTYKDQVEELVVTTGNVAQTVARTAGQSAENTYKASVDFTRDRLVDDLTNIKNQLLGRPPVDRAPVLSNAQSPYIDYQSANRTSVTIVGWNLDVAARDPGTYRLVLENTESGLREVGRQFIAYHGQYAVTVNTSGNGVPLQFHDSKLVFENYEQPFSLLVINSDPPPPVVAEPPPPPRRIEVSGELFVLDHDSASENEVGTRSFKKSGSIRLGGADASFTTIRKCVDEEVRAVVVVSVEVELDGTAVVEADMKLYEGSSCRTNDLDGSGTLRFRVAPGTEEVETKTVRNTDDGGDRIDLTITVSNATG